MLASGILALFIYCFFSPTTFATTDYSKLATLAQQRYGLSTRNAVLRLQNTVELAKTLPDVDKLKKINDFFNNEIKYFDDDINVWGEADYWATPLESLGKERGDCEDFAIAKYIFLREIIPNEKLKLTYVKAQIGGPSSKIFQAHMILSYYASPTAEPLILDNLIGDIRPASRRGDLIPIFSFNSEGLWTGAANTPRGDSISNLSRWRSLLVRIQADGIE
jgi:predicted transglutaminase-like cysteine proteinase